MLFADLDPALVSIINAAALPDLAPNAMITQIVTRLAGSRLSPGDDRAAVRQPSRATHAAVGVAIDTAVKRADVGTALPALTPAITTMLSILRGCRGEVARVADRGAPARAPCARRNDDDPLPCLTGLTRSRRYTATNVAAIEDGLLPKSAAQARDGSAIFRQLKLGAAAWRDRLAELTAQSRAGEAAGLFLVWLACSRSQPAAALGSTQAKVGGILDVLVARGIVERRQHCSGTVSVAQESLGDFKLEPHQKRHAAAPE